MMNDYSLYPHQCFQKALPQIKLRRIQRLELRKSTVVQQATNKALSTVHEPKLNEHVERISNIQITFLYTCLHKGERFSKNNLFLTCARTSNRQKLSSTGSIKGEALRLLKTKSSNTTFEDTITIFKQRLRYRGYPDNLIDRTLSEVNISKRMSGLQNKQKTRKNILPFVTEYRPSVLNLKTMQMSKWHLIENQPQLREIYKDPSLRILSYRKGSFLKYVLVRANCFEGHILLISTNRSRVWPVIIILPSIKIDTHKASPVNCIDFYRFCRLLSVLERFSIECRK